jgi:hypothetical protein
MKTNETHESVSRIAGRALVLVSLLAVALALAASSFAQTSAAAAPRVADAKAAKAPRGTGEGIQIHGWWNIEVRNHDGSVAKHVEFENALVQAGPSLLSGLLSGNLVAGSWLLWIEGDPSPCSTYSVGCAILPAGSGALSNFGGGCTTVVGPVAAGQTQPFCYETLEPSLTGPAFFGTFAYSSFTLSGQAYVDTSTLITSVISNLSACGVTTATVSTSTNTTSPSACYASDTGSSSFTEYDFGVAPNCSSSGPLCQISVQAGQIIAASVTFSFSSPSSQSADSTLARPHPILRAPVSTKLPAPTPVTQ